MMNIDPTYTYSPEYWIKEGGRAKLENGVLTISQLNVVRIYFAKGNPDFNKQIKEIRYSGTELTIVAKNDTKLDKIVLDNADVVLSLKNLREDVEIIFRKKLTISKTTFPPNFNIESEVFEVPE